MVGIFNNLLLVMQAECSSYPYRGNLNKISFTPDSLIVRVCQQFLVFDSVNLDLFSEFKFYIFGLQF
jgi:hypothetical protein